MSIVFSFFFDGLVQYLSKIVLANQFCADRDNDAGSVPLQVCQHGPAGHGEKSTNLPVVEWGPVINVSS